MNRSVPPNLSELTKLNSEFCRSARIDQDTIEGSNFIYSETIDQFLNTLAGHQEGTQKQGAFTWTGPYGSGKSTLALSVLSVLTNRIAKRCEVTKTYKASTAQRLVSAFNTDKTPWEAITIIGDRVSFFDLLKAYCIKHKVRGASDATSPNELVNSISNYCRKLSQKAGLIIVVDEMGKLLEHAITSKEGSYIYQLLAEAASRSKGKFVFVGILHQTLIEYASNSIKTIRDDWSKVQGRFIDISLNLNSAEQIELISSAISSEITPDTSKSKNKKFVNYLSDINRAPSQNMGSMLDRCWPLNPVAATCLGPISRRSYGQNQRSIFSFLNSGEPLGFSNFLYTTKFVGSETKTYTLANLWDYLSFNWSNVIAASQDSHSFAIANDLIQQIENLRDRELISAEPFEDIIKAIHLLQMTSQQTGINAKLETISMALNLEKPRVNGALNTLLKKSLLSFRSHNKTYTLHEGSDFEIDDALKEELSKLGELDLDYLSDQFLPNAIIAKRHYLQTGTLRWANIKLARLDQIETIFDDYSPTSGEFCKVLLIPEGDPKKLIPKFSKHKNSKHFVFGALNLSQLTIETIREFSSLLKIQETRQELARDRIARREVNVRIDARREELSSQFIIALEKAEWHTVSSKIKIKALNLNSIISEIADQVFNRSINITNELVNRNKLSGNAIRASKQLLYDVINHEGLPNLGYKSFPAARGLFESILKSHGIYSKNKNTYNVSLQKQSKDPVARQISTLFGVTMEHLESNRDKTITLKEIHDKIWSQPPFGVKSGLFPILTFLFVKLNSSKLAYYRDEIFTTKIEEIDVDVMIRTPKYCSLRFLDMDRTTKNILSDLAEIPANILKEPIDSIEPLEVAKKLIAIYDSSSAWAKRSSTVSDNAKRIRGLFARASDPAQFTLVDLPNLFGEIDIRNQEKREDVFEKIQNGLIELIELKANFLQSLFSHLMKELGVIPSNKNNIEKLHNRAVTVKKIAGDTRVDAFITNLTQIDPGGENIERIASFLVNKPPKAWIDNDTDKMFIEVTKYARQFINLETMSHIKGKKNFRKALSIVSHDNSLGTNKMTDFAIPENDFTIAENLLADIKHTNFFKRMRNKEQLVATLLLLIEDETSE